LANISGKMDELKATYHNKNLLVRIFSKLKVLIAINFANLEKEDVILDFGCGAGWLKNKLKSWGYEIYGYDATPKHSDIKDYTKLKPQKIFVLDVFEHIPEKEIMKIIKNFKKMNKNVELIVAIPTENFISRKVRKLLGKSERVSDHITPLKDILKILRSEFKQIKKINLFTVSYIVKFKNI
jgi:hypothetical protein